MDIMSRGNAREEMFYGNTLEDCIKKLLEARRNGKSIVMEFNGHKLYSCDVTVDEAYLEVYGQTKAEFDREEEANKERYIAEQKKREARAEAKAPEWIEEGRKHIYPERMEEWKETVKSDVKGISKGENIQDTLRLMEKMEKGASKEELTDILREKKRSIAYEIVIRRMMLYYSKKGPDFYEATATRELTAEERKIIENVRKENAELERIHNSDSSKNKPTGSEERDDEGR